MGGTTFAEVLDYALDAPEASVCAPQNGSFQAPHACLDAGYRGLTGIAPTWAANRYPRPAAGRPVRALGPAERHALDELAGLGARLREDFTSAELRSAFRALARRFHPDRCTDQSPADQAHAARIFAFIVGHYRCLAACGDL
jgi:hypothetical protein